jgi:hypothetical protein
MVDASYTWNPSLGASTVDATGKRINTMQPESRVANQGDIDFLHLEKVTFNPTTHKGNLGSLSKKFH